MSGVSAASHTSMRSNATTASRKSVQMILEEVSQCDTENVQASTRICGHGSTLVMSRKSMWASRSDPHRRCVQAPSKYQGA